MGPCSVPPCNMNSRVGAPPPPPPPPPQSAAGRVTPLTEITFDIEAYLGGDQLDTSQDLLQNALAMPVPVQQPPPAPAAVLGQSDQTRVRVARRDELARAQRLLARLPRLPPSALPPGVTQADALKVLFQYAVCQQRSREDGNILLHKLAKRNDVSNLIRYTELMIRFKHKTHLHTTNRHGETPLHVVTGAESARALLERGARLDLRDALGNTPIHLAARHQRVAVLAELLQWGPSYSVLDAKNLEGYTALHLVVIHQLQTDPYRRGLELLIESGVDVNVADDTGGRSALFHAVLCGDELAVRELVENNAAVNMADFSETTPLQAAEDVLPADNNHICSILLERGGFKVPPADRVTQSTRRGSRRRVH